MASSGTHRFVSPLSVSVALGMTLMGASGQTAAEMREVLRLGDLATDQIGLGYLALVSNLVHADPRVSFEAANGIWYREQLKVLGSFVDDVGHYFLASVEPLDFAQPEARNTINTWIEEATHGHITDVLRGPFGVDTLMVLVNAIYFKASWTYRFDPAQTGDRTFTTGTGEEQQVPTMRLHAELPYLRTEDFQAVRLPYGNERFCMTLLVPGPGTTVAELTGSLTEENWTNWSRGFRTREGYLWLPRFEMRYRHKLNEVLSALGMQAAFTNAACFDRIFQTTGAFISEVIHETYVQVDEEGTEAAAVTAVVLDGGCGPDGCDQRFYLSADRPFLFVIHERELDAILFIGRVTRID